jgi:hypothetical protein
MMPIRPLVLVWMVVWEKILCGRALDLVRHSSLNLHTGEKTNREEKKTKLSTPSINNL